MNAKTFYTAMRKAHPELPSFQYMDEQFQLAPITEGNVGRQLAVRIVNKSERYRDILERYMHPSLNSLKELTELNTIRVHHDQIREIYERLCTIERKFVLMDLTGSKKANQEFLLKAIPIWVEIQPQLVHIMSLALDIWRYGTALKRELEKIGYIQ